MGSGDNLANKRDLSLNEYNISKYRYRELKNFCLQYREKKMQLSSITLLGSAGTESNGKGNTISDRTANDAIRIAELKNDIDIIEASAREADESIQKYILANVVDEISYDYMDAPIGRRQFYAARRKFFYILSQKK